MGFKNEILMFFSVVGAIVSFAVDGVGIAVVVLCSMMLIDFITGLIVYAVLGLFDYKKALIGLVKKLVILIIISGVYLLGLVIPELNGVGSGVAIGFTILDFISIVDNATKINIGLPKMLLSIIQTIKEKAGENK